MPTLRNTVRILAPLVLASLAAGCAIGPNYKRPPTATTNAYKNAVVTAAVVPDEWWTMYNDQVLNDLEKQVVVSNQNIAEAAAAYMQARALVREDRSNLLPSISLSGSGTHSSTGLQSATAGGSTAVLGNSASTYSYTEYQLGASAQWELDVWGRLRRTLENARESAQASAADLANATLSARSALATAYLQLRGDDAQRRMLADTAMAYQRTLTITQNKYKAGVSARTDVLQAQAQVYSAQDQEQALLLQRAQLENSIAALIGKPASGFTLPERADWNLPVPQIPAGVPSQLLQRRPDIAAAERSMAAANANIGVQEANYFPAISLTSTFGYASTALKTLFESFSKSTSYGASLSQTLLDFGARRAEVDQARDQYAQAVASYRQTVLTAFQDVENDLVAADIYGKEYELRRQESEADDLAEKLTLNEYNAGTVDFTTVIVAQTTALSARLSLAQMKVSQQTTAVSLIGDLGGGWKMPDYTHYE
ncbi:MAG TPA: efflux transporter outer membrane subunit [Steroidobacteraceae bacterium]|nr:efflux transporter outer membrane subunit [Steroidobacteraceae bacterium]